MVGVDVMTVKNAPTIGDVEKHRVLSLKWEEVEAWALDQAKRAHAEDRRQDGINLTMCSSACGVIAEMIKNRVRRNDI